MFASSYFTMIGPFTVNTVKQFLIQRYNFRVIYGQLLKASMNFGKFLEIIKWNFLLYNDPLACELLHEYAFLMRIRNKILIKI